MALFSKVKLSGSTDGKGILVAATATPGTPIHTAVAGTANWDEIYLYAMNTHTADVELTIEWGGTGAGDRITQTIALKTGSILVVPGLILQNGQAVAAFASVTNVVNIMGFVNRITA